MIRQIILAAAAAAMLLTGCGNTAGQTASSSAEAPSAGAVQDTVLPEIKADTSAKEARISYLGPEGTYTQEACGVFFDGMGSYLPCETVGDAVDTLVKAESSFAVIPQENTIGGAVTDYIDILISNPGVSVVGEVELPINQNLLVMPGTKISDIRTVYSHKQGIAQGKEWLEANLPEAEIKEAASTAEGAKMVSEGGDPTCGAIASAACADVYGLEILAAGIQNNDSNKTRFYVLSAQQPPTAAATRIAFIADGNAADLPALMTAINEQGIRLIALHDRPKKTVLGEYQYVIECAGCSYEQYVKLAEDTRLSMRFLGSFDVK